MTLPTDTKRSRSTEAQPRQSAEYVHEREGPLSGAIVLDFGQAAVGPIAATYLGLLGAEVVKVERPHGDFVRAIPPTMRGTGTTFIGNNLNKQGVVLDLREKSDAAQALALIEAGDVLVENFRSRDVMANLGLGPERLFAINPSLVYVQSTAFGGSGPWAGMYSHEWVAEATSGLVQSTGESGGAGEFTRSSAPLDWHAAMVNTLAALAGLVQRDVTGHGVYIETSQLGSSVLAGMSRLLEFREGLYSGDPLGSGTPAGAPDGVYQTRDGRIAVTAADDESWLRFCEALGLQSVAHDQRFESPEARARHRRELDEVIGPSIAKFRTADLVEMLTSARVAFAVPRDPRDLKSMVTDNVQAKNNEMFTWLATHWGDVLSQTPHWEFSRTPARLLWGPPKLGQHNRKVFEAYPPSELGDDRHINKKNGSNDLDVGAVGGKIPSASILEERKSLLIGEHDTVALSAMLLLHLGCMVDYVPPADGGGRTSTLWSAISRKWSKSSFNMREDIAAEAPEDVLRDSYDAIILGPGVESSLGGWGESRDSVVCRILGRGKEGPLSDVPASELTCQIESGLTRSLGAADSNHIRLGFDVVSSVTALSAVQGVLAAWFESTRSGLGQEVSVSMLHCAIATNQWDIAAQGNVDEPVGRQIAGPSWPPDHGFTAKDGRCLIEFMLVEDQQAVWQEFAAAIGADDVDEDALSDAALVSSGHVARILNPAVSQWALGDLRPIAEGLGGIAVPCLKIGDVTAHPQISALMEFDGDTGIPSLPIEFRSPKTVI